MMRTLLLFLFAVSSVHAEDFLTRHQDFAARYCLDCHDGDVQKGDFRLDDLELDLANFENLESWQVIQQVLIDGDMPPQDKKQPSTEEREGIIREIGQLFAENEDQLAEETRMLRQLTPYQLQNSLRDLLGIERMVPAFFIDYPETMVDAEFDTMGSELSLTFGQVKSLAAITENLVRRELPPERVKERKPTQNKFTQDHIQSAQTLVEMAPGKHGVLLYSSAHFPLRIKSRVSLKPEDEYRFHLRLKVKGVNSIEAVRKSSSQLRRGYNRYEYEGVKPAVGLYLFEKLSQESRDEIKIAHYDLNPGEEFVIDREILIPENYELQLRFETAPFKVRNADLLDRLEYGGFYVNKTANIINHSRRQGISAKYETMSKDELEAEFVKMQTKYLAFLNQAIEQYDLPRLTIYDLEITDLPDPGPSLKQYQSREKLKEFAERAFRRPVTEEEILPYYSFLDQEEGYIQAIQAIIASPQFIYHTENPGALNSHSLASRLSYALWGTIPDEQLTGLAADGSLLDRQVLSREILRMLADEKSKSLTDDFLYQWLHFVQIQKMPPDRKKFGVFYQPNFKDDMLKETELFFRYLLDHNLSVSHFINSDFTFVNSQLADFYGLEMDAPTTSFQKVAIKDNAIRGGLIGQASVLTASADGVDTSPVFRGVWFSEKMFDIMPPPPPDGVAVTPDTTEGDTVKEILALHTEDISCSRCHTKIDPLGFALENYDALGQWREIYEDGQTVDAAGEYKGIPFTDIEELKQGLKEKTPLLAESFVTKFLTYSLGRKMTPKDQLEIDRIVSASAKNDYGVKELIYRSLTSKVFLTR